MKTVDIIIITFFFLVMSVELQVSRNEIKAKINQSKEHHERYHNLLIENNRLKQWYENWLKDSDCDTFGRSGDITINCEKLEL